MARFKITVNFVGKFETVVEAENADEARRLMHDEASEFEGANLYSDSIHRAPHTADKWYFGKWMPLTFLEKVPDARPGEDLD